MEFPKMGHTDQISGKVDQNRIKISSEMIISVPF